MSKRKRVVNDDYIGPAKGWTKFFHRLFLFVTFPLRKPWWTLLLLAIMFLAPTFAGVKPAEVHLWYWGLLKKSTMQVSDKAKDIVAEMPKIEALNKENKTPKMVSVPSKSSGRKMFERAKSAPIVKTIKTDVEQPILIKNELNNVQKDIKEPQIINEKPKKSLDLVYLDEPKRIKGMAIVVNANEIKVDNTEMFLYGVYVSPYSSMGKRAKEFLMDTINGKDVECLIKAYTYQSVATAICYVEGLDINRQLVDLGYSKNVALD